MGLPHLISIIGAGPGDPELLTVKAQKRLEKADVVLYDALMGEEILSLAKTGSVKIYVGKLYKDGQNQEERQNEIHHQFLFYAEQKKRVVRLKAGDPMIFGRGAEEIRFCKTNNLNYEVIPGITAGIAGASLFEIPLTERDKNGMALFYTGHRKNGGFTDLNSVKSVLQTGSPVLVYMGLNNLPDLAKALINSSVPQETPIQILSKVSQVNQKIYETNLGEVFGFLQLNKPETPAIIIIGKNANRI